MAASQDAEWSRLEDCPLCGEPTRAHAMDVHQAGIRCRTAAWRREMERRRWAILPDFGRVIVLRDDAVPWETGPAAGGQHDVWAPRWACIVLAAVHGRFTSDKDDAAMAKRVLRRTATDEDLQGALCSTWELAPGDGDAILALLGVEPPDPTREREMRSMLNDANRRRRTP